MTLINATAEKKPARQRAVLCLRDVDHSSVAGLLSAFGLSLKKIGVQKAIPGSYWGDEEAGLVGNQLLARVDTPVHSILHETCHYVCMDQDRRQRVHTDAGGDYDEENAVCYLQILLADLIDGFGRQRMFEDMDRWGYTFRLGCAQTWFEEDATDARAWLQQHVLIDANRQITWTLRKN